MAELYSELSSSSEFSDDRPHRRADAPHDEADPRPKFAELDAAQCHAILDRNRVGRIAFAFHDQVDIAPVHYVRRGPWLYGRTSPGAKLTTIQHKPWVAFEVDEMEGLFDWRSVVVHGAFYQLQPGGTAYDVKAWDEGFEALQELIPATFIRGDPVPFRMVMFRISIDSMTGRSAKPGTV